MDDKAKLEKDVGLLDGCIERFQEWALMRDGDAAEADPCALCAEYLDDDCGQCPIADDGHLRCAGTPYEERADLLKALPTVRGGPRPSWMTCADAAAEVVYLVDLREKLIQRLRKLELEAAGRKIADECFAKGSPENAATLMEVQSREKDERDRPDAFFMKTTAEDIKRLQARAQKAEASTSVMNLRLGAVVEAFSRHASKPMHRHDSAEVIVLNSVEAAIRKEVGKPDEESFL